MQPMNEVARRQWLAEVYDKASDAVAGVDEVGRGPLVGNVVAAAVVLDPARPISGLRDSKRLSEARRETLAAEIRECALDWAIGEATASEIDQINILQAALLAMRRAVEGLRCAPVMALVDGNRTPELSCATYAVIKGDGWVPAIQAASIVAKQARDQQMLELHAVHPEYGFDRHKGYPTPVHLAALERFGALSEHRRSFGPVRRLLDVTS